MCIYIKLLGSLACIPLMTGSSLPLKTMHSFGWLIMLAGFLPSTELESFSLFLPVIDPDIFLWIDDKFRSSWIVRVYGFSAISLQVFNSSSINSSKGKKAVTETGEPNRSSIMKQLRVRLWSQSRVEYQSHAPYYTPSADDVTSPCLCFFICTMGTSRVVGWWWGLSDLILEVLRTVLTDSTVKVQASVAIKKRLVTAARPQEWCRIPTE